MMKQICITAAALATFSLPARAGLVVASDNADNAAYDSGWADASAGGFGLGAWSFATESGSGFAGRFIADQNSGGPSNVLLGNPGRAWALFANNGADTQQSAAFRGLGTSIGDAGTSLQVTFEHGFIADGGRVGIALRSGNANASYADVTTGAVAQLYFEGGDGSYTAWSGEGETDTGAGFGLDGLTATFSFTGGGHFDLRIDRYFNESGDSDTFTLSGLTLASGGVDSIAIFNDDGGDPGGLNNDAYFNSLTVTIPAPGSAFALVVGSGVLASRRRRSIACGARRRSRG